MLSAIDGVLPDWSLVNFRSGSGHSVLRRINVGQSGWVARFMLSGSNCTGVSNPSSTGLSSRPVLSTFPHESEVGGAVHQVRHFSHAFLDEHKSPICLFASTHGFKSIQLQLSRGNSHFQVELVVLGFDRTRSIPFDISTGIINGQRQSMGTA